MSLRISEKLTPSLLSNRQGISLGCVSAGVDIQAPPGAALSPEPSSLRVVSLCVSRPHVGSPDVFSSWLILMLTAKLFSTSCQGDEGGSWLRNPVLLVFCPHEKTDWNISDSASPTAQSIPLGKLSRLLWIINLVSYLITLWSADVRLDSILHLKIKLSHLGEVLPHWFHF